MLEMVMPLDSLAVATAVILMFVVFGVAMMWADKQTRDLPRDR
jgi:hypothetical protein